LKLRQLYKSIKNNQIEYLSQIKQKMTDIQIDSDSFFAKLQKINQTWKQVKLPTLDFHSPPLFLQNFSDISAICLVMGKVKEEAERPLTSDFL
jgi:hypothetical protein